MRASGVAAWRRSQGSWTTPQIFTMCRNYYGELLVWRGAWDEAERALAEASRDLAKAGRDASDSLVRLAELRRRQRRFEEAEALLAEAEGHPLAAVVAADSPSTEATPAGEPKKPSGTSAASAATID